MDAFDEIRKFRREMNRMFDRFFSSKFEHERFSSFREPYSDLEETEDEVIFKINLPGVDKKDVQLLINENTLEIKAEKKSELKIKKKNYSREESSYKGFHKVMSLPCKIIPDEAESDYKNGVLEIRMPKAEKKKLRKIEIK